MKLSRLRWVAGLWVVIAAGAAAADSPEELLKARGLKRVGSTYILASESDVQKKTTELRALYNQLGLAARRQAEAEQQVEDQKGMMRQMLERRVFLNDQITLLDQQLRNIGSPAPGNVYGIAARNELVSQRNAVVTEYNGLGDRIRQLQQGELADPKLQDQFLAEVSRRREGFMQGVLDLRQLVDAATKSYAELASDAAVKEALETLGRNAKTKPKLAPSTQFASHVKLLERIEKSVMTDSVDLRKQGGVFWVDATFNGKVVKPMVFDTGAGLTTIPARLADEIGLKPSPSDPVVHCETADGTVVEARRMTIPSLRIGRFQVNSVDCAVMPASKGDVSPLLGQSFHRHFTYKFTPESGHLIMSRVEGLEPTATTKAARPTRGTAKAKSRAGRSRGSSAKSATADGPDGDRPD
jgi:aspartyl protease family protein